MRIFTFHLLNDYSGSPKVLSQLLKIWKNKGYEVHMVTGKGREGFLTNIDGINYHYYTYKFSNNQYVRLLNFSLSQLTIVFKFFFIVTKKDIIYVNTVLPFGAAILAKMKGCKLIYHIHETTVKPPILKRFLFGIARKTASKVIFVSHYLEKQEPFLNIASEVVYNSLENDFIQTAVENRIEKQTLRNALLVCSLKEYKGVDIFVRLAEKNPANSFRLVVNANKSEIDDYFKDIILPSNLEIFDVQTNLHPFYQWADSILNLSKPDGWIETFGLTIAEGMAYGLPAIIPPIGGITELVDDGENGFQVDSRDFEKLNELFQLLVEDSSLYQKMAQKSILKIEQFSPEKFEGKSIKVIESI
jgi:glycosyltransferase involved in cell wall biosynthesis